MKWGKESYDVDIVAADGVDVLRAQIFALTSVPTDRQKLLFKGKMIKVQFFSAFMISFMLMRACTA